jgi:hypothetical protein
MAVDKRLGDGQEHTTLQGSWRWSRQWKQQPPIAKGSLNELALSAMHSNPL